MPIMSTRYGRESAQGGRSGELLVESYFITEGGGWGAQRSV